MTRTRRRPGPILRALAWVAGKLGRALSAFYVRIPPSEVHLGIRISTAASDDPDVAMARIKQALTLVHTHDPQAFQRCLRHLPGFFVREGERRPLVYASRMNTCMIGDTALLGGTSAELLAVEVVRQGARITLRESGVRDRSGARAAVDVICSMAARAFALRLPDGARLVEREDERIDMVSAMSEAAADRIFLGQVTTGMKQVGVPEAWADRFSDVAEERGL